MRTTVVNKYIDKYDEYIGRGSVFGNPYTHRNLYNTKAEYQVATAKDAIEMYKIYFYKRIETDPAFLSRINSLKGKRLGCFCKPKNGFNGKLLCHGQIIAGFLESDLPENTGDF